MAQLYTYPGGDTRKDVRPPSPETFGEYCVSDTLREPRPREWLIDASVMRRTVSLMTGAPGTGKSRALQQLLSCAALGRPWIGRDVIRVKTLMLACEDDQDEMERRQADICAHLDVRPGDFEDRYWWNTREGKTTTLMDFERFTDKPILTPLWIQLWEFVHDNGIQLVCLDPAASVFGGNSNFDKQVRTFIRACHQEAIKMNGAVIINAHPNKSDAGGYSGSIQWIAACRFAMSFRRPPDYDVETDSPADARQLWGLKANYLGRLSRTALHYQDGVFVPDDPTPPDKPVSEVDKAELDGRLMMGLRRALSHGARVPANVVARGSMPYLARAYAPDLTRMPLNSLYDAQARLIGRGQIVRVNVAGHCLIRPYDSPGYEGEKPWQ